MSELATVGIDLAKSVFQVHGVDENGRILVRRQLRRSQLLAFFEKRPRCLIGMEACAGAHDWGRRLRELGHDVRLMPPSYVKPYVKRGKTDAADAAAICEAVTRPSMRFVAIKSEVRIPIEAGQVFRGEAGHRSDLKPAGIPISFRPPD